MRAETRQLKDLVSIGPAMLEDFELLGIRSVAQLKRRDPQRMYRDLCRMTATETAVALGVSEPTVKRDMRLAQAWLRRELETH